MSPEGRSFWPRPPAALAGAVVLVVLVAVVVAVVPPARPASPTARLATEAAIYALIALACLGHAPLRRALAGMGPLRGAALAALLGLAVAGQLLKEPRRSYPFVGWGMYSDARPQARFVRWEAVLASGRTIDLPFHLVAPSTLARPFAEGLEGRVREAARGAGGPAGRRAAELEGALSAVAGAYNRRFPTDPIRDVRALSCSVPVRAWRGPESVTCRRLATVAVTPAAVGR